MSVKLDEIKDPRTRKRIEEALRVGGGAVNPAPGTGLQATDCKRPSAQSDAGVAQSAHPHLSTDEAKLNKTERAFLGWLRASHTAWIGIQAMTLKLADDCRYTPDFESTDIYGLVFWEVKGHWRDDARVKIKVAARMFSWARFTAVQRVKGEWKFEEIKP